MILLVKGYAKLALDKTIIKKTILNGYHLL